MRFYSEQHRYYCGIDLHARSMYVCVLDQKGKTLVHRNLPTEPAPLLRLLKPYRKDVAIAVECLFCWYWVADLCATEKIPFVLGHALYMKAVHGGKSKNDKIDSYKIAALLRGGNLPEAYVYPSEMRATRDVLRRRLFFVRHRAGLLTHIQMINTQYNLPPLEKRIDKARNRIDLLEHFEDEDIQMSVAANMTLLDSYDQSIAELELFLEGRAKVHDASTFYLLRTVPGIGRILSLTILYEIHQISRFPTVGQFLSYGRLVAGQRESAGKIKGSGGRKMGNAYLKWHRDISIIKLPLEWARAQNVHRAEVYIRPARQYAWPVVFLDDVATEKARAIANKYDALVVETSPAGGCHVWLSCTQLITEPQRREAQRWLAERTNADLGSISGEHLGRLAGFKNWKRGGTWVNVVANSLHGDRGHRWDPSVVPTLGATATCSPQPPPRQRQRARDASPSGREWGWVCGLLESGCPPERVYVRLLEQACVRRGCDAPRYARRTLERALERTAVTRRTSPREIPRSTSEEVRLPKV